MILKEIRAPILKISCQRCIKEDLGPWNGLRVAVRRFRTFLCKCFFRDSMDDQRFFLLIRTSPSNCGGVMALWFVRSPPDQKVPVRVPAIPHAIPLAEEIALCSSARHVSPPSLSVYINKYQQI